MAARPLQTIVEAILFASEDALSAERIAGALERQDATPGAVRQAIADLNEHFRQDERAFEIVEVAGGYKMMTLPEYNSYVRRVLRSRSRDRLSQAALETLAIIAYRQPVTRAEIENIRGVEAGPVLRMLVDRGVVRIVGRQESLGHPLLYGTSKLFLETFGLRDLDQLPRAEELMAKPEEVDEPSDEEATAAAETDDGETDAPEQAGEADDSDTVEAEDGCQDEREEVEAESSEALADAMAALSGGEEDAADEPDVTDGEEADGVIRLTDRREEPAEEPGEDKPE